MNADERRRAQIDAELAMPFAGDLRRPIDAERELEAFKAAMAGMVG